MGNDIQLLSNVNYMLSTNPICNHEIFKISIESNSVIYILKDNYTNCNMDMTRID